MLVTTKPATVTEYIAGFPNEVQEVLEGIRATVKNLAPEAEEKISYGIPTFMLHNAVLVHYAAFKNHIGFYALPTAHEAFKKDFSPYKTGRGSVQFPLDQPMPLELITKVVKFRIQENKEKAATKKSKQL